MPSPVDEEDERPVYAVAHAVHTALAPALRLHFLLLVDLESNARQPCHAT
jgi:hypothetical protein